MSWASYIRSSDFWDPIGELLKIQSDLRNWGDDSTWSRARNEFPPVNVWSQKDEAFVSAEVPGLDPKSIDVTVGANTLTLKGVYPEPKTEEGEKFIRRERLVGQFTRTIELPFAVNSDAVEATYAAGMLTVKLPRAEADKPKKIAVN